MSIHALVPKIQPDKVAQWCRDGEFFGPCLLWPNGWKVEGLKKRLGLGLARSWSRSHLMAKIRRLGLVELQESLGLGLVSDQKPNVSVS